MADIYVITRGSGGMVKGIAELVGKKGTVLLANISYPFHLLICIGTRIHKRKISG